MSAIRIAEKIAKAAQTARDEGESTAITCLFSDLEMVMSSEYMKEGIQSFIERREAALKSSLLCL